MLESCLWVKIIQTEYLTFLSDFMELRWTSIFVGLAGEKNGQEELI